MEHQLLGGVKGLTEISIARHSYFFCIKAAAMTTATRRHIFFELGFICLLDHFYFYSKAVHFTSLEKEIAVVLKSTFFGFSLRSLPFCHPVSTVRTFFFFFYHRSGQKAFSTCFGYRGS
jgi:hypothetical protein